MDEMMQRVKRENAWKRSWIFSDLDQEALAELDSMVRTIDYEKGEVIFHEGELSFGIYFICHGKVKLAKHSVRGKRQVLKLLGAGELLGEKTLFDRETYTAYAKTLEPSRVAFIERKEFLAFLNRHPEVSLKIIEKLSRELKAFQSKLVETSYESATERLARLLLLISKTYGTEDESGLYIGVELSRAELAEMAGLSTETAIRTLGKLKNRNFVELDGHKICILDKAGLGKLAEPFMITLKENLL
ncbi:MAG: Crp/Fnr family transcriptional regulator [Candidatus Bipolaricaulia bacterium]